MDISRHRDELEAIIPGVVDAYQSLKTTNGMGFYTSNGALFNHTFFGRDNAMAAKFVADFDHQAVRETIIALVALQGTINDRITHEAPGRIHHEYRDFTTWRGSTSERLLLTFFAQRWGAKHKQLLTYYATDTTALFIRLVNKYVSRIDKAFLGTTVTTRNGEKVTVGIAVARAADWINAQIDQQDHFVVPRTNEWALPYQTFQDSSTAFVRTDGSMANFRRGIAHTEAQAFACDALEDATQLLNDHHHRHEWQSAAHALRNALLKDFWSEEMKFFGNSYDAKGLADMPSIGAGWTLNTSLWDEVSEHRRAEVIGSIVAKLFSNSFLTPVGLRCRAIDEPQPLKNVIEYHGAQAVWPMFTFMVIEGLRRHNLYRLAMQLENRLINAINADGHFPEFFIVTADEKLIIHDRQARTSKPTQMLPEENMAFTIIPSMTLARRASSKRIMVEQSEWQRQLEDSIMPTIPLVELVSPLDSKHAMPETIPVHLQRWRGNISSALYVMRQRSKM